MNQKIILTFMLLALGMMLAAPSVSASCSGVTADATAQSSRATVGTNVVIDTSISASSSCQANNVQLSSSPSGITVTDPSTGYYTGASLTSSATTFYPFTISASTANTYTYYISVDGTTSTAKTIVYENPSVLSVSGSPSSTTKDASGTFTLSVTVTNSIGSDLTTSYSLTDTGSGVSTFSYSGDPTSSSGTTIGAYGSKTLSWTVTLSSGFACGTSNTISLKIGSTAGAFTTTVSSSACATATTGTTGTTSTSPAGGTTTTTTPATLGKSLGAKIYAIVQRTIDQIKTLMDDKKELKVGLQLAIGKELSATIREQVAAATQKAQKYVEFNRTSEVDNALNRTTFALKISYNGTDKLKNFVVFDVVPKTFASSSSLITVTAPGATINVTNTDPSYTFTYATMDPNTNNTLSYMVTGKPYVVLNDFSAPDFLVEDAGAITPATTPTSATQPAANATAPLIPATVGGVPTTLVIAIVLVVAGMALFLFYKRGTKAGWDALAKKYVKK